MISQDVLKGHWEEVAEKIKEKWNNLSEDDLRSFNGNVEQLIGRIQRATGEGRAAIENFLDELNQNGFGLLAGVRAKVEQVGEKASAGAKEGLDAMRQGYAQAEQLVHERPGQTMVVAFGLGIVAGLGAALLLRQQPRETRLSQARSSAEHFGKQILAALAEFKPEAVAQHFHR